jgi:hypothetical protein
VKTDAVTHRAAAGLADRWCRCRRTHAISLSADPCHACREPGASPRGPRGAVATDCERAAAGHRPVHIVPGRRSRSARPKRSRRQPRRSIRSWRLSAQSG